MNIDDMTREEVQAELERRGIDVSKQAERVLAAVRRERACDRCGLPTNQPDLDVVIMRHADPDACIAALKAENERLRGAVAYLRENVRPPAPEHPAWCWPDVWKEFERRVDG